MPGISRQDLRILYHGARVLIYHRWVKGLVYRSSKELRWIFRSFIQYIFYVGSGGPYYNYFDQPRADELASLLSKPSSLKSYAPSDRLSHLAKFSPSILSRQILKKCLFTFSVINPGMLQLEDVILRKATRNDRYDLSVLANNKKIFDNLRDDAVSLHLKDVEYFIDLIPGRKSNPIILRLRFNTNFAAWSVMTMTDVSILLKSVIGSANLIGIRVSEPKPSVFAHAMSLIN